MQISIKSVFSVALPPKKHLSGERGEPARLSIVKGSFTIGYVKNTSKKRRL